MALNYQQIFTAIVKADASQAVTELRKVDGQVEKVTTGSAGKISQFSSVAKGAMVGVGAAAAFSLGKTAVNAASKLSESVNAVNVTFGDAADGVLALGENASHSFGLSKSEFNGLSVQFSAFAKQVAGDGGDVSKVIGDLATRAADFASVMDLDLNEATAVFMSTLAGETEPIRRFGKDVSAAAVEQYALAAGLVESKGEITESIKVQARYGLLMQQTSDTAGDFANTSGSLANQQRQLGASLEDAAAKLGEGLIPALESMTPALLAAADAGARFGNVIGTAFGVAETVGTTFGKILSPWNAGAREANAAITNAFNASNQAAAEFDTSLLSLSGSFEEARGKAIDLGLSEHAANVVALEWKKTNEELGATIHGLTQQERYTVEATEELKVITQLGADALDAFGKKAHFAADEMNNLRNDYSKLIDELSHRSAFLDIADQFDAIQTAAEEAYIAAVSGSEDAEQKNRDYEQSIIDAKTQVYEYGSQIAGLPERTTTDIIALIDNGKLDEAERRLNNLSRRRDVAFTPRVIGGTNIRMDEFGNVRGFDNGGVVPGPRGAPQLAMVHGGETILPTHKTMPSTGSLSGITLNIAPGAVIVQGAVSGDQVVDAIAKHVRQNGPGGFRDMLRVA
jgi:murein DD-endopeptidase MepM/ murein hydrolase activator NlpD